MYYTLFIVHILTVNQQCDWLLQNVRYIIWNLTETASLAFLLHVHCNEELHKLVVTRLWIWWTGVWFPAQARDFSLLHSIQISCGSHSAPIQWLSGALHRALKWPQPEAGCSSPFTVPSTHLHSIALHLAHTQMYHLQPCCVNVVGMGSVL